MSPLHSLLLETITDLGSEPVARAMGKDPSVVRGITSQRQGVMLADLEAFLAGCGMRVVKADAVLVDADELRALRVLAKSHIERSAL